MHRVIILVGLLALVHGVLKSAEGDKLERDDWFVGHLGGQPAMSLHATSLRHADGSRTTRSDQVVVISRKLGERSARLEVRDAQVFTEDAAGNVIAYQFDHEEGGARTTAAGTIVDRQVTGAVLRLGRSTPVALTLPAGTVIVGDLRSQEILVQQARDAGTQVRYTSLGLLGNQVQVLPFTATFTGPDDAGRLRFDVVTELMPVTAKLLLTPRGVLAGMTMNLLVFQLDLTPSPGPVALLGAELDADRLVLNAGPTPRPQPSNRFLLPAEASPGPNEFQHRDADVLTVSSTAAPSTLDDSAPFLAAGPNLELDDPELRAWVGGLIADVQADPLAVAERLRLAVRSHIQTKDLNVGDGTALQAFRSRRGDCSEHAALLCAALRIAGLPARIENGIVFVPDKQAWVGHAWNSVWIGGSWRHLDAAYPGVARSCYIALTSDAGNGIGGITALLTRLGAVLGKTVETLPD